MRYGTDPSQVAEWVWYRAPDGARPYPLGTFFQSSNFLASWQDRYPLGEVPNTRTYYNGTDPYHFLGTGCVIGDASWFRDGAPRNLLDMPALPRPACCGVLIAQVTGSGSMAVAGLADVWYRHPVATIYGIGGALLDGKARTTYVHPVATLYGIGGAKLDGRAPVTFLHPVLSFTSNGNGLKLNGTVTTSYTHPVSNFTSNGTGLKLNGVVSLTYKHPVATFASLGQGMPLNGVGGVTYKHSVATYTSSANGLLLNGIGTIAFNHPVATVTSAANGLKLNGVGATTFNHLVATFTGSANGLKLNGVGATTFKHPVATYSSAGTGLLLNGVASATWTAGGPTTLISDQFNTGSGSPNGRTPSPTDGPGSTWTVVDGTWNLTGSKVQSTGYSSGEAIVVIDAGSGNSDVTVSMDCSPYGCSDAGGMQGVIVRYADVNNYWMVRLIGAVLQIYKCVSGTFTFVSGASFSGSGGATYTLTVKASGSSLQGTVTPGGQSVSCTMSPNTTNTKVGIRAYRTSDSNTLNFDNFKVTKP